MTNTTWKEQFYTVEKGPEISDRIDIIYNIFVKNMNTALAIRDIIKLCDNKYTYSEIKYVLDTLEFCKYLIKEIREEESMNTQERIETHWCDNEGNEVPEVLTINVNGITYTAYNPKFYKLRQSRQLKRKEVPTITSIKIKRAYYSLI